MVTQSLHWACTGRAGLQGGGPLCTVIAIPDRKGVVDPSGRRTTGKHLLKATCGKSYSLQKRKSMRHVGLLVTWLSVLIKSLSLAVCSCHNHFYRMHALMDCV